MDRPRNAATAGIVAYWIGVLRSSFHICLNDFGPLLLVLPLEEEEEVDVKVDLWIRRGRDIMTCFGLSLDANDGACRRRDIIFS